MKQETTWVVTQWENPTLLFSLQKLTASRNAIAEYLFQAGWYKTKLSFPALGTGLSQEL